MTPQRRDNKKRSYCREAALGIQKAPNFLGDLQGVFLTSAVSDKHTIASEAFRMLKEHTEAIPNALEQEEHRFEKLIPGAKGTLFVYWPKIEGEDSPEEVCQKLAAKRAAGYNFDAIAGIFPINATCRTEPREMEERIVQVIGEMEQESFDCEVKIRNNAGLHKSEVLEMVREVSRGRMLEDEENSSNTLLIQICECNCMIGWVKREEAPE